MASVNVQHAAGEEGLPTPATTTGAVSGRSTKMLVDTISNSKLHFCVMVAIIFNLIVLSVPFYLINLANQEDEQRNPTPNLQWKRSDDPISNIIIIIIEDGDNSSSTIQPTSEISYDMTTTMRNFLDETTLSTTTQISNATDVWPNVTEAPSKVMSQEECAEYGYAHRLIVAEPDGHCGKHKCKSCPNICLVHQQNCDGIEDCPDSSDEEFPQCDDRRGYMRQYLSNLSDASGDISMTMVRPLGCSENEFWMKKCKCTYTDPKMVYCEGQGIDNVPSTMLGTVLKLLLGNNSISSIDNVMWPEALTSVQLDHNRIKEIGPRTFKEAPGISILRLNDNKISQIDNLAFYGLNNLSLLNLDNNQLETFNSTSLAESSPKLTKLYLMGNKIVLPDEPHITRFGQFEYLKELQLDQNKLRWIRAHWFSNMSRLSWLLLSHNEIEFIEDASFANDFNLIELNLSYNKIKSITRLTFAWQLNIDRLFLNGNPISQLTNETFREVTNLTSLDLGEVELIEPSGDIFSYLDLQFIYFAQFRYCHYARHATVCRPRTDGLSTLKNLLAFRTLQVAVWVVATVCCLSNIFVLIWRTISPHENPALSLLIRNLSLADLMMGVYLATIAYHDLQYRNIYKRFALDWMDSLECSAIGFLNILSSELSVFILTIITIERYRSITSVERQQEEEQRRRARVYVIIAWILSLAIAAYPLIRRKKSDYYATNGLCLPLHIDQPYTSGWMYSAFVYLGINFVAVLISIGLYIRMYSMIISGHHSSHPALTDAQRHEDAILAIRFFLIVLIDSLCWVPLVVIKFMALAHYQISPAIYGWLMIFIIPINSALNPILYTLAAPTYLRSSLGRLLEQLFVKLELIKETCSQWLRHGRLRRRQRYQQRSRLTLRSTSWKREQNASLEVEGHTGSSMPPLHLLEKSNSSGELEERRRLNFRLVNYRHHQQIAEL